MEPLRRSQSSRSMRRSHHSSQSTEPFDPELARFQATTAASRAMLRSKCSYDVLGGPSQMAVPQRQHRPAGVALNSTNASAENENHRQSVLDKAGDLSPPAGLPSIKEFGGFDAGIATLPSSYRRLRKTRSMFTNWQRSSHVSRGLASPGCPSINSPPKREPQDISRAPGTLRRSMSFFRGDTRDSDALRCAKGQEAAIELARNHYQQPENYQPEPRKSSLVVPKSRREHKPFKKTLRSGVSDAEPASVSPATQRSTNVISYGKARSLSSSLKKGIKKVFGFSRPSSARVSLGKSPSNDQQRTQGSHSSISEKQSDLLKSGIEDSVLIHSPGTEGTVIYTGVKKSGSSESLATSRSRVTSWADSTIANTVVTHRADDHSSLYVIDEQDSSVLKPGSSEDASLATRRTPKPNCTIDSQRLYSALMRRIDGNKTENASEEIVLGHVKEHRAIPTPVSSMYTRRSKKTIRLIASDESLQSPGSYTTADAGTVTPCETVLCQAQRTHGQKHLQGNYTDSFNLASSKHTIKEASRDGTGNVAMGRSQSPEESEDSPSNYSRSTGGNSPSTLDPKQGECDPELANEPGVATIYASQRAIYSSPKRDTGQGPDAMQRPSGDWQQWMHTQMERIECLTPTRRPYREDAQIQDETADFAYRTPSRDRRGFWSSSPDEDLWTTCKVTARNNFSRPFSRSSSIRTTIIAPKEQPDTLAPPPLPADLTPKVSSSSSGHSLFINQVETRPDGMALSPVPALLNYRYRAPESPTPRRDATDKARWRTGGRGYGRQPSRLDSKASQFKTSRAPFENRRWTDENVRVESGYHEVTSQDSQLQNMYSPISSKRMVDMFLESRRRRMGTDIPDGAPSEGAFI
ncbi:uncharacterized protein BO88DRAFT_465765 [Aspergillus vadensis CBS 113365]|uniref:Uncharacterized protein n=1 Tax=Aspergillus vadensis (strain CBS 113365 / IMI 142717 / IBT 24658) TaxID=1448311 RepID=A0A319B655_ASPVC|nr:hypothetical protein BO88DRAFT_465765 [Aspergillus vadensis CBS 113365]PYH67294.1 hypothetical protein BO88DRAFT_465765 [Aspergillus vadensis CBS 113365]